MRQIIWFLLLIVCANRAWAADCRPAVDQLSAASSALDAHHDKMIVSRLDWASLEITDNNRPIYVAFAETAGLVMKAMQSHVTALQRALPLMTMCRLRVVTEFDDAQMATVSLSLMAARIAERETADYLDAFAKLPAR